MIFTYKRETNTSRYQSQAPVKCQNLIHLRLSLPHAKDTSIKSGDNRINIRRQFSLMLEQVVIQNK